MRQHSRHPEVVVLETNRLDTGEISEIEDKTLPPTSETWAEVGEECRSNV